MLPPSVRHLEAFFAAGVDPVDYAAVLRYHDAPDSEIKQVVLVASELKLEQVWGIPHVLDTKLVLELVEFEKKLTRSGVEHAIYTPSG